MAAPGIALGKCFSSLPKKKLNVLFKQYAEKIAKSITVCLHIAISTALDDQRVWLQFAYPPKKCPSY